MPEKRADSPASGARFVRCGDLIGMIPLHILYAALADEPEKGLDLSQRLDRALFVTDDYHGFK